MDPRPHSQASLTGGLPREIYREVHVQLSFPGRDIFSLSFTGWNIICDRKRMAAILGHLVSLDIAELMSTARRTVLPWAGCLPEKKNSHLLEATVRVGFSDIF